MKYILIFVVSFFLNWGVQLSYCLWRTRKNPKAFAGQRTLLQYYSGYIGDAIIVPLINVLIYYVIKNYNLNLQNFILSFIGALSLDIITHFHQGYARHTNWSMSKPFKWNFAGRWHMVSFAIQVSYLLLFFWIFLTNLSQLNASAISASLTAIFLMLFFCLLYILDIQEK